MNPQANAQQPPNGWPQHNLHEQMGGMNLSGPPKQPSSLPGFPPMPVPTQFHQQQQQHSTLNNNQQVLPPPSGAQINSFASPTNNNQFPVNPAVGGQNITANNMSNMSQMPPPQRAPGPGPLGAAPQQQQRPPAPGGGNPMNAPQNGFKNGTDYPPPNPMQAVRQGQDQQSAPPLPGQPPVVTSSAPFTQNAAIPPMNNKVPVSQSLPSQPGPQISKPADMPGQMSGQMPGQFPGRPNPMPGQMYPQQNAPQSNMQNNQMQGNPPMAQPGMPPLPGQNPMMQPQAPRQMGMPPMPGQNPMTSQYASGMPPTPGQNQMSPQYAPGMPPMPGQQNSMAPPMPGSNAMHPPMPGQNSMMPPMPGTMGQQQQQPGMPPMPQMGQHQMMNQKNSMAPPMPGQNPMMQQQHAPGMPPMPGQQPSGPGNHQYPGQYQQYPQSPMQAQPARRLDPDQMPNPIQVMADNQKSAGGAFSTAQIGQVPPLVTTNFITQDQGNSGPRYVRSTMYNIPATTEIMKQSAVPFALVISPMAKVVGEEMSPPIVDFGEVGPIRCVRCKAYMSPYMQFIDAGRRFQCLLCKATTEVPPAYFQHLDHTGQRADKYERPELVLGTYEFLATKDYCRNNMTPNPPAMIFVIDVSYNNIKSGLVHLLCSQIKNIVKNFPIDQGHSKTKMKVGFITYNKTVHFYNIKSTLAQPQMMVVGDVHEMFMPLLDGFLADPEESEAIIDLLMEQIPKMFGDTRETETILLPAIQAGLEALKASECVGKLLVFHSTLPVAEAPGQLKNRDDRKLLGTEKEKQILSPQNTAYNNLGQDCVNSGCSVDLFIFNNSYIDLATIGQVSRLTGGEIYKYTYFQADIDGQRLIDDLVKHVGRPLAFDAVMRVRTSTGTRPTDFYGHFFMSNTTDMEIAAIDSDKSIAIEIKHDDKLPPEENVYVQIALLYTSTSGQRRLRILNLAFRTCIQLADLFRSCDLDTTILFFAKQGVSKLLEHTPKVFRDNLVNRAAQILACYRKNCASPTSAGQLILPECLKLLPLYVSCLLKNDAFSGGSDMTVDDRSYAMYFVASMDLPTSVGYFYPRLIPIHNVDPNGDDIPAPIRCTFEKMTDDGAYILENGIYMFIYLGYGLNTEFTQQVFASQTTHQIDTDRVGLPVVDNPMSKRIRDIVDKIQHERTRCMRVALVRQRDKLEMVLRHFLIEDRGSNGAESYVDFLCYMHKEIRSLLS